MLAGCRHNWPLFKENCLCETSTGINQTQITVTPPSPVSRNAVVDTMSDYNPFDSPTHNSDRTAARGSIISEAFSFEHARHASAPPQEWLGHAPAQHHAGMPSAPPALTSAVCSPGVATQQTLSTTPGGAATAQEDEIKVMSSQMRCMSLDAASLPASVADQGLRAPARLATQTTHGHVTSLSGTGSWSSRITAPTDSDVHDFDPFMTGARATPPAASHNVLAASISSAVAPTPVVSRSTRGGGASASDVDDVMNSPRIRLAMEAAVATAVAAQQAQLESALRELTSARAALNMAEDANLAMREQLKDRDAEVRAACWPYSFRGACLLVALVILTLPLC